MDTNQNDMNQGENQSGMPQGGSQMNQGGMSSDIPQDAGTGSPHKKPLGPVIGIIVIIVLVIFGGLYLWGGILSQKAMTPEEILNEEDTQLTELQTQGTSDEVADIEADLGTTDLEGIDAELEEIEQEFESL